MSMQIINWDDFVGSRGGNSDINTASELYPDSSNNAPHSPLPTPYSLTIGVFDGVHLGHQSLIQRICAPPAPHPHSPLPTPHSLTPAVITFKQNPQKILNPAAFPGDIITLEQKLGIFEDLGVKLAVLIDFSEKFSTINGRDFIDLLLGSERDAHKPVKLIALGRNFRCGHGLDTGADEVRQLAEARGVEVWIAPPVMDGGQPVSSSRIRQALADGRVAEAQRLLGRSPRN